LFIVIILLLCALSLHVRPRRPGLQKDAQRAASGDRGDEAQGHTAPAQAPAVRVAAALAASAEILLLVLQRLNPHTRGKKLDSARLDPTPRKFANGF